MDYYDPNQVGTGWDPRTSVIGWGSGEEYGNSSATQARMATQLFQQQFKNLIGRDPTKDELGGFQNQFLTSAINNPGDLTYGDASGGANAYIQNSFGPQAAAYSQQQQTDQLGKSQTQIQDLINKTMGNTASALSDPQSQIYQQLSGQMNNLGITPSSGAFQAGAGSTIASSGMNAANEGLQAIGIPGIQSIAQTGQNPYQTSFGSGSTALGNIEGLQNFGLQEQLAEYLAKQGNPSGSQSIMGMATGGAQGAGSLLQGGSEAYKATSYVCKELIKRGLLCESDMDDFHIHIMPAMLKKGRAFWKYAMDGFHLVEAANKAGIDWAQYKPLLFDRVIREKDPCRAVDLYAAACYQLCMASDSLLWDSRVFRTSFLDSLPFLPRLFLYKPFREALAKCLHIKMLWIYHKPTCQVHR